MKLKLDITIEEEQSSKGIESLLDIEHDVMGIVEKQSQGDIKYMALALNNLCEISKADRHELEFFVNELNEMIQDQLKERVQDALYKVYPVSSMAADDPNYEYPLYIKNINWKVCDEF